MRLKHLRMVAMAEASGTVINVINAGEPPSTKDEMQRWMKAQLDAADRLAAKRGLADEQRNAIEILGARWQGFEITVDTKITDGDIQSPDRNSRDDG